MNENSKSSEIPEHKRKASFAFADLAAGAGIALLGVFLGAGSFGIPLGVGYDRIGPRFFPSVVAAGLTLLGVWLAAAAVHAIRKSPRHKQRAVATTAAGRRGGGGLEAVEEKGHGTENVHGRPGQVLWLPSREATNWRALGLLAAALLLSLALLDRGGFVIASSVLFWTAARGFGSRRPWRDAGVAVALAVVVFLAFTRGLGLALPLGVLGGLGK